MTVAPHPLFEHRWPEGEFRMFQLGFVVPDLMAAAANWVRVFGVGPFHIMPRVQNTCRYRGADGAIDIHIGVAQAGPVQIELIRTTRMARACSVTWPLCAARTGSASTKRRP